MDTSLTRDTLNVFLEDSSIPSSNIWEQLNLGKKKKNVHFLNECSGSGDFSQNAHFLRRKRGISYQEEQLIQ